MPLNFATKAFPYNLARFWASFSCKLYFLYHHLCASPELRKVRKVSQKQRNEITCILQKYHVHLRSGRRRFGGIDSMTGFTLKLIDSVVDKCEFVSSAEQMFSSSHIWERTHAKVIMEVIKTVWGNWIMFSCQLWSIDYEQSLLPLRDIWSRKNIQARKKSHAAWEGYIYIRASPQISLSRATR